MLSNSVTCCSPETNETTLSPRPAMKQTTKSVFMDVSSGAALLARQLLRRDEGLDEAIVELAVVDDRAEKHQALAGLLVLGDFQQRIAEPPIVRKLLGTFDQPQIELVVQLAPRPHARRGQLVEIVDEMTGMHAEQARQQQPGIAGHMRARSALELREIGLADLSLLLLADRPGHFGLSHFPAEAAGVSFQHPEVVEFLSERHCNLQCIANCNIWQGAVTPLSSRAIRQYPSPRVRGEGGRRPGEGSRRREDVWRPARTGPSLRSG